MRIILTLQVAPDEQDARMVNRNVSPMQLDFPEITVVEDEDRPTEIRNDMHDVEMQIETKSVQVTVVHTMKASDGRILGINMKAPSESFGPSGFTHCTFTSCQ
jgi:hypothetical protein